MELSGRTALVTGGAVRVGRAISLALADAGAHVIVHYNRSERAAADLVGEISERGGRAGAIPADLSSLDGVTGLAREAESRFAPIDVLVNNASIFPSENLADVDSETWESAIAVNLRAPFFLTQQLGGAMKRRGGGVIVNIADLAGLQVWAGYAAHSISKAGLVHLTRVAARALAPEVRVVGIAPGTVLPPEEMDGEEVEALRTGIPLRRIGSPEDVAAAVLHLVDADFMTGHILVVDGGRLLR